MTLPNWHEEPISKRHDRAAFDCGDSDMNIFLQQHARRSHDQGGAKTFLAVADSAPNRILGFYSLSPASVEYGRTPAVVKRGLARYDVPVYRLGRLGVDQSVQGLGLGKQLVLAAGRRCLKVAAEAGGVAMLIDAKTEGLAEWYRSFGAVQLEDAPLSLMLPLATVKASLDAAHR